MKKYDKILPREFFGKTEDINEIKGELHYVRGDKKNTNSISK